MNLENLTNDELIKLREKTSNDVSKFDIKQKSIKVQLNSLYGGIGNEYFRFFDVENAEAVTLTGQFIIQFIEKEVNAFLNKIRKTKDYPYVIYCDTDSVYICLDKPVTEIFGDDPKDTVKIINYLDKICKTLLQPMIDETCHKLTTEYINGMGDIIKMVRDVITDKAIWTSKKRYIMNVYDTEGLRHDKPKLKMMGIEAVKSSTPKACRDKIKEAINIIFTSTQDAMYDFIAEFKLKFPILDPEDIAFPRSVNGVQKYTEPSGGPGKGAPMHVKGAIRYNQFLDKMGLNKIYPYIKEGEKIKYIHMKLPNIIQDKVFAFPNRWTKEMDDNLRNYIDYDEQFEKSFIDPLRIILGVINWKTERVHTIADMFGW